MHSNDSNIRYNFFNMCVTVDDYYSRYENVYYFIHLPFQQSIPNDQARRKIDRNTRGNTVWTSGNEVCIPHRILRAWVQ